MLNAVSCVYLGREFPLCTMKSDLDHVKLYNGVVYIYSNSTLSPVKKKSIITDWYKKRAQLKFNERLSECVLYLTAVKRIQIPNLIIDFIYSKNKISYYDDLHYILSLNVNLIKTPIFFIDYVIYYSIFHLILKGNDSNFIKILPKNIKEKMSI